MKESVKKKIKEIIENFDDLTKNQIRSILYDLLNESEFTFEQLWNSDNEDDWKTALDHYCDLLNPSNIELEKELEHINLNKIRTMSAQEWFDFLHYKYFVWKYTAANRYATTTKSLRIYQEENILNELITLRNKILEIDLDDIKNALNTAKDIKGLGVAGASGLLAILYPHKFGTVDQFVVKRLIEIRNLPEREEILQINPESITINQGVLLIQILRKKASDLKKKFKTKFWTPRRVDMVLWASGR